MKTNNLQVKLLSRYYLITALASAFMTQEQKAEVFDTLRRIYCLEDDTELEAYRTLSEREPYGTMMTLADYERECRVIEYSSLVGKATQLTDADRVVLAAKGEALRDKQAIVDYGANFTKDALREQLADASAKGNVHALGVLALIDTYGFGMGTNPRRAERVIEKAERWNDIDVILLSAELHPERGEELVGKLATVFRGDADSDILTAVAEKCGVSIPQETDSCSFLMERAFQRGAVERGTYDAKFASFIYTEVIRYEDKARIIDNYKKENGPLYDDIPTHINM
jgi:hypothetical protein